MRRLAVLVALVPLVGCGVDPTVQPKALPTVEVERTPEVCREALDAAEELIEGLTALVQRAAEAGVVAGATGDEAQLAAVVEDGRAREVFGEAAEQCRDAA